MSLPDHGVDLDGVDVVLLLERILDLSLVCPGSDNEDESVVLLNLLHGGLGVERVEQDLVLVDADLLIWDGLAWVLWCARELEGLGTVEGGRKSDLADLVRVDLKTGRQRCILENCELTRLKGVVEDIHRGEWPSRPGWPCWRASWSLDGMLALC